MEISVCEMKIRLISGYGPQENWCENKKTPFFEALEAEVSRAELEGRSVIICMDANSKLGPNYIKGDPHSQSQNGKLLAGILDRHALIVLNSLKEKSTGIITRQRVTENGLEESVIDFVIMSSDLITHVTSVNIDDRREHVLVKLMKDKKKRIIKTESDHNLILTELKIEWKSDEHDCIEVFNFKEKEAQKTFFNLTNETRDLVKVFETDKSLNVQTKKFVKRLNGFIQQSFKKVKITRKGDEKLEELYNKRRVLRSKTDYKSMEELEALEDVLAATYSESMAKKIRDELKEVNWEDGGFNPGKFWKLEKKLSPKQRDPPTAIKDSEGNILTTDGI